MSSLFICDALHDLQTIYAKMQLPRLESRAFAKLHGMRDGYNCLERKTMPNNGND